MPASIPPNDPRLAQWFNCVVREDIAGMEAMLAGGFPVETHMPHDLTDLETEGSMVEYACLHDKVAALECMVKHGASLSGAAPYLSPLHYAGSARVVDFLVSQGMDPCRMHDDPLAVAIEDDRVEVVQALVRHGARVRTIHVDYEGDDDSCGDGESYIKRIIKEDNAPMLRAVAKGIADINAPLEDDGFRPENALVLAARYKSWACVQALVELGADLEARNPEGWTALMLVALSNTRHPEAALPVAKLLIEAGADPHARCEQGSLVELGQSLGVAQRAEGAPALAFVQSVVEHRQMQHGTPTAGRSGPRARL